MRKLLVKLVALETAVLGWLTYWLFLVYANNPSVSQGLVNELSRFPQVSYTTIDISIIVIIAVFSIVLAVRFDRGLRPGMKLERALQMLENLMKRNLFLEAQLAETRVDKPATGMITQTTVITPPPLPGSTSPSSGDLLRSSSWEKAFRIPIEAGPTTTITPPSPVTAQVTRTSVEQQPSNEIRTPPIQLNSPGKREDRPVLRPAVDAQKWEDSPRKAMETTGIISTSQPPPRRPLVAITPPPGISSSGRPPYIPMPAPKTPPANVITGPMVMPTPPQQSSARPGVPAQARPTSKSALVPVQPTSRMTVPSQPKPQSPPVSQLFQPPRPSAPPVPVQTSQKPNPTLPPRIDPKTLDKQTVKDEKDQAEDDIKASKKNDDGEESKTTGARADASDEEEESLDDDSE